MAKPHVSRFNQRYFILFDDKIAYYSSHDNLESNFKVSNPFTCIRCRLQLAAIHLSSPPECKQETQSNIILIFRAKFRCWRAIQNYQLWTVHPHHTWCLEFCKLFWLHELLKWAIYWWSLIFTDISAVPDQFVFTVTRSGQTKRE